MLTLIYTSGTTGPPKGVQLTHANELAECRGIDQVASPIPAAGRLLPAPRAHRRPRAHPLRSEAWGRTITGCRTRCRCSPTLPSRPTFFGSVPRMWEKLKAALEAGIAAEPDETRRTGTLERDRAWAT